MTVLNDLPCCPIWRIEPLLRKERLKFHAIEGDEAGNELALVTDEAHTGDFRTAKIRGVATLAAQETALTVRYGATDQRVIAAFGRSLATVGWKSARTLAHLVYGTAS